MQRKWLTGLLIALLLVAPLHAMAAPELSEKLFTRAKDTVSLIAYGEYQKAIEKMNLSENEPSVEDFESFVNSELSAIFSGVAQKDVAVAYTSGKRWIIAVPVVEPTDDSVRAFLLSSPDGKTVNNFRSMKWGEVMEGVNSSDDVIWNVAYDQGVPYVIADN